MHCCSVKSNLPPFSLIKATPPSHSGDLPPTFHVKGTNYLRNIVPTHFSCPSPNHSLRRTRGIVRLIASLLSHNENIGKWKLLLPLQIVTRVKSNLYLAFPGSSVAEYILPFSRIQIISWREVSTEGKLEEFQRTILTRSGHFAACQQICHMPEETLRCIPSLPPTRWYYSYLSRLLFPPDGVRPLCPSGGTYPTSCAI